MTRDVAFVCGWPEMIDKVEDLWKQLTLNSSFHSMEFSEQYAYRSL